MKNLNKLRNKEIVQSEYYNSGSFYKETWFVILWVGLTFIYARFFLPPIMKKPNTIGQLSIAIFVVLICGLFFFILTDYRKSILLKRLSSILILVIFGVLFYFYSGAKWNLIVEKFFNLKALHGILPIYLSGLIISLKLTIMSIGFAVFFGLIIGVLRSFHNPVFEIFFSLYVDLFRAIPLIALMIIIFYAFPFLGLNLEPLPAATSAIVLMYSAYIAEIFRAGIEAIGKIQLEAASSLGLTKIQTMRLVVLPQAIRIIIPPLTSSLVGILKDTSVAYVVTLPELLTKAQQEMLNRRSPTPVIGVSIIYFLILFPLTQLAGRLESRSNRWSKKVTNK